MYTANSLRTIAKLLGGKPSVTQKKSKDEKEKYLRQPHSDSQKDMQLNDNDMIPNPQLPACEYNYAEPTMIEIIYISQQRRGTARHKGQTEFHTKCSITAQMVTPTVEVHKGDLDYYCSIITEGIFEPKE